MTNAPALQTQTWSVEVFADAATGAFFFNENIRMTRAAQHLGKPTFNLVGFVYDRLDELSKPHDGQKPS